MAKKAAPLSERFHAKYAVDESTGCWLWQECTAPRGYGLMSVPGRGARRAHRISWELHRGKIPKGLCICHKCDTPRCVNPDHLFLGTYADNNADKVAKGRCGLTGVRGEKHPAAKLSVSDVRAIRASSESLRALGARYGMHFATIGRIKRGDHWKTVT